MKKTQVSCYKSWHWHHISSASLSVPTVLHWQATDKQATASIMRWQIGLLSTPLARWSQWHTECWHVLCHPNVVIRNTQLLVALPYLRLLLSCVRRLYNSFYGFVATLWSQWVYFNMLTENIRFVALNLIMSWRLFVFFLFYIMSLSRAQKITQELLLATKFDKGT